MKICKECNIEKEFTCFSSHYSTKDKLRTKCRECRKAEARKHYRENKEKMLKQSKKYYKNNYEFFKEYRKNWDSKKYYKENSALLTFNSNKRRIKKLKATPKWLTEEMNEEIKQFYILAKELRWLSEEDFHVDHIIPLQGKNVSGLHVPWNLQLLPKSINLSKGNR